MEKVFDVLIVGAGPGGTATAIALGNSGLSVGILDKATFPRDKTCGDALSVDVVNQLKILSPSLYDRFIQFHRKTSSYGVQIFSPDRNHIDIPFEYEQKKRCGYICQRLDFDNLLLQQTKACSNVHVVEDCQVIGIENKAGMIHVHTSKGRMASRFIVGADGAHSIVAKELATLKMDRRHNSAGLRVYYEGVTSCHGENFIELHFFREILPGYLWIFPLPGNKANVGLGMLSSAVAKKKINLKEILNKLLTTHPGLKERFLNATALETVKGYGLPLGSKKRSLSGDRFVLTGDAASLIDPFTGEGIANAIRSGRIAASHIVKCFEQNNFSKSFNQAYDEEVYRRMWNELRISRTLQHLCKHEWLFNYIVRKANNNKLVHEFLIEALAHVDKKKSLAQAGFYYRLLMSK